MVDNLIPCSLDLWAVQRHPPSEGGVVVGRVIGWTLIAGAVHPVVIPRAGLPAPLLGGADAVTIYEAEREAYDDAERP